MKRLTIFSIVFLLVVFMPFINSEQSDNLLVTSDVLAPVVSVSVPDSIYLGTLTKGYDSDEVSFLITNTGTSDIKVTAQLSGYSGSIYNNLYIRGSSGSLAKLENFTMNISKPTAIGGNRSLTAYVKLKLSEYTGDISSDMINHKANITFWAMPQ